MSAPSGSGPTYLPIEYEYYYLEFVNWQNDNIYKSYSYTYVRKIKNKYKKVINDEFVLLLLNFLFLN